MQHTANKKSMAINFNAQHSPMGAFMSFTCGNFGTGGGIGLEIGKPADQNLFIGVKHGSRREEVTLHCLPFLKTTASTGGAVNYDVERAAQQAAANRAYATYAPEDIEREYRWGTDRWVTPDFEFSIHTPFGPIPAPGSEGNALRDALLPAVIARLQVDNRKGTRPKTAVFAIDFNEPGTRLLNHDSLQPANGRVGFAWRRQMGVMAQIEGGPSGLELLQRWSVAEGLTDKNPIHMLGNTAGVVMEVPAGQTRTMVLAIGVYRDGIVTTGLETRYSYTRHYAGLEDVLNSALDRADDLIAESARLDESLERRPLTDDQRFMIAHATRSYYGSTQLLDIGSEPFWVVNEGEYCMMNTLDLTVDQVFWELQQNPWVVKNELDMFTRHYTYHDQVRAPGGRLRPGGISFSHDMGVNNNFSPRGRSSYELQHLHGCFSYMTMEELANWVLTAACYVAKTGDRAWLTANRPILLACAESLRSRCNADGIMAYDSSYCAGGSEITTYDSLDESLGQARSNSYIAVKTWACWIGFQLLNSFFEDESSCVPGVTEPADAIAFTLLRSVTADGTIPAVLEMDNPGYQSRILPVIEALVYPWYWLQSLKERNAGSDAQLMLAQALTSPLVDALKKHTLALLRNPDRSNLFADGGLKLSSTSNNSWMSKILLFQYVCSAVLRLPEDEPAIAELFKNADAAHTRWQTSGISAFWACSDQFINGEAKGSRYYPRIVTASLFLAGVGQRITAPAVAAAR
ncbi:MAG: glycoside hydrolase family 52 protein [Tepidisphaeraceae bacterium]